MIELLTDNHYDAIMDLFDNAKHKITIISPFLNMKMVKKLCECVSQNGLKCDFITRIYLEDLISKVNNIDAIEMMVNNGIHVYAQKYLHTKLYMFDNEVGIIGSANFTSGGFISNVELSIMASDEPELLGKMSEYCSSQLALLESAPGGKVTKELISEVKEKYLALVNGKSHSVSYNTTMYGAILDKKKMSNATMEQLQKEVTSGATMSKNDIMMDVFREDRNEKEYDHNIWLKFDGSGENRIEPNDHFPLFNVNLNGTMVYIQNYSFDVKSIKDGDEIFLAAVSSTEVDKYHKNQPIIVGRAKAIVPPGDKRVLPEWIKSNSFMERYPYYCVIDEIEIIDTNVSNGIPLSELWGALGPDTYKCSFGKQESISQVSHKHYQKAHIRLSGNAKEYLDERLEELFLKYGVERHFLNHL